MTIFTLQQEFLINKLYFLDNLSLAKIGEIFYCHASVIKKIISSYGAIVKPNQRNFSNSNCPSIPDIRKSLNLKSRYYQFTHQEQLQIVNLYQSQISIKNIAAQFECGQKKITKVLISHGVKINERGKGFPKPAPPQKQCLGPCHVIQPETKFHLIKCSNGGFRRDYCRTCISYLRTSDNAQYVRIINHDTKRKREFDPSFRLRQYVSGIVRNSLHKRSSSKLGKSVMKFLPHTIEELRKHLESQFEPWMTWDNWGVYDPKTHGVNPTWQIDHIIPHSQFHYSSMGDIEFQQCWALSNLRPLDARQNVSDGNRRILP